MIVVISAD